MEVLHSRKPGPPTACQARLYPVGALVSIFAINAPPPPSFSTVATTSSTDT